MNETVRPRKSRRNSRSARTPRLLSAFLPVALQAGVRLPERHRLLVRLSVRAEVRGRGNHLEVDVTRLDREKRELIAELQKVHGEKTAEILRLEGSVHTLHELLAARNADVEALRGVVATLQKDLVDAQRDLESRAKTLHDTTNAAHSAYAEIARLQGLLDMIYRSRTWKLHTMVEKMKGRG